MNREFRIMQGDIATAETEAIVNAWNRNFIPYWLLWPKGVSAALKRRGGTDPFKEVRKFGLLDLGEAVVTGAGDLRAEYMIHAAALHAYWTASRRSIDLAARSCFERACELEVDSMAIPLLGAGTGAVSPEVSADLIHAAWADADGPRLTECWVYDEDLFARLAGRYEIESQN